VAGGDAGGEAQTSPATYFLGLGFGDCLSFSIQDRIAFISVSFDSWSNLFFLSLFLPRSKIEIFLLSFDS